ncbi:MAG: hypothetical protein HQL48_09120 [Gammaproteobacteria bacterium]|nr:hypothetical protein [Gammaproteobacteria bacterium]
MERQRWLARIGSGVLLTLLFLCFALIPLSLGIDREVAFKVEAAPSLTARGEAPLAPTFAALWERTLSGCGLNCHSPEAADGSEHGPDLSQRDGFLQQLRQKRVADDYPLWRDLRSGDCNQLPLLLPGDPLRSTLVGSLIEEYAAQIGQQQQCHTAYNFHATVYATLERGEAAALVSWVARGAPATE